MLGQLSVVVGMPIECDPVIKLTHSVPNTSHTMLDCRSKHTPHRLEAMARYQCQKGVHLTMVVRNSLWWSAAHYGGGDGRGGQ